MKRSIVCILLVAGCAPVLVTNPPPPPCTAKYLSEGVIEIDCPLSAPVLLHDGLPGLPGVNGIDGTNGTNGTNGTIIVPIQLCAPSFVPSYPNVFVESAFCINGELYGVFSDHGGFLTLLPPGRYSSNGINASCSFEIKPGCVVEN